MRRMRTLSAIAVLSLAGITACAPADTEGDEVRVLSLSHFMEASHPHERCGFPAVNEHLEQANMRIETYPAAQLGGEAQSLELVNTQNLDMSTNGPSFLGVYDSRFNVLDAAYAFDDAESQRELSMSGAMDELLEMYHEETGMKVFRGWYYGTRHMTANKPIQDPTDLRGLKLRAPDAPLYRTNIAAMGGTVTPMALNELYMGLQQGVVDAQENPLPTISTMNLQEVQSDLSLTGHMVQALHISVAEDVWTSLTRDEQSILEEAINMGAERAYECVREEEESILADFEESGAMTIHEVGPEAFADDVRSTLSEGQPFSEEYRSILELQK